MTLSMDVPRDVNHLATGGPSSMVFVRTLGAASIEAGGTHLTAVSVRKFALLLYLWGERGRSVTRATLHDLIFPDQTAQNARHSIRELIYKFRKFGARIASVGETVELAPDSVRADVSDVLGQERPSLDQLRAAQGGFLPGYAPTHSEAFTEWLEAFRGRTIADLNRVFVNELNRSRKLGDWSVAEAAAQAILALDPLHEEATLATAEMLAMGGAKAQAMRLLDKYQEEVGPLPDLKIQAALLRRRINERSRELYRPPLTLPFLGRDAEMTALQERFARARAGEAQCVVLVGEAGIGKTRLAEELCTQAVLAGASVERVATQPHDTHRPMATFADLVPKLLELPGALGCAPESISALRRLTKQDSEVTNEGETNSEVIAAAIGRAIADLIDSIASEGPLVLFVDDAQWSDERSRQTLATLAAARHARRLMFVLTSRDRSVLSFLAQRSERVTSFALAPLAASSSKELTTRALIEHPSDNELRDWIAATSGGNPFFLKCLIGHYQATAERFVVPGTLSVLLDQKVNGLSPNAAALLRNCVALGRHSEIDRVLDTLEMPQIDLQLAVAELDSANLICQTGKRIEPAHALVADAVSRSTSAVVWRLVHRRVASVLQAEARASDSPVLLWDCAEHWLLADERERAAEFWERCALTAVEIGRPREGAELLLRAAAMVGRERAVALARRAALIATSGHEGDIVKRAIAALRGLNVRIEADPLELLELNATMSEWDDPEQMHERLHAWLASTAPLEQRINAGITMLVVAEADDRSDLGEQVFDGLIRHLPDPDRCNDSSTLTLLLIYHATFGDLGLVREIAAQLLRLVPTVADSVACDIYRKCAIALFRVGDVGETARIFSLCYDLSKRIGLTKMQHDAARMLVGLYHDTYAPDEQHWQKRAEAIVHEDPQLATRATSIFRQLDIDCGTGDVVKARRSLAIAQRFADGSRLRRIRRWINAAVLRVRHLQGDLPTVTEALSLTASHRRNSEATDIGDFEVAITLYVLASREEYALAQQVLSEYLSTNRRGWGPRTRMLQEAIALVDSRRDGSTAQDLAFELGC